MIVAPGIRVGAYEVTTLLGEGGMGQVWRAHHTGLKRDDAIKVLPAAFAADRERLARFEREAQILASLNHQHIAHVYGLETAGDTIALVMELVEGPTLADRIAQGPLPLDEALAIAEQIAEALDAAHEQGIVHRDLKPANVKVRADGVVKVLDFGLAKAMDSGLSTGALHASQAPTITTPAMTQAGMILGTAAYMSPEQARGRPVDRRTDIWAFGCVLYEMLTGQRAFCGEDITEVLASVVKDQPDLARVPARMRRLIAKCLEKDPKKRLQAIGDRHLLLADEAAGRDDAPQNTARRAWLWPAVAALFALLAVAAAWAPWRSAPPEETAVQFSLNTPAGIETTNEFGAMAVSPDGKHVVFAGRERDGSGGPRLFLRAIDALDATPLQGTEGGNFPTWSPDSRSLAFTANPGGVLKRLDMDGSPPITLAILGAEANVSSTGVWSSEGFLLVGGATGIRRVPATGGEPTPVTTVDASRAEQGHGYPQLLPDGQRFLYFVQSTQPDVQGVYVSSLDQPSARQLVVRTDAKAVYAPQRGATPAQLLWLRDDTLMAQEFDPGSASLRGEPTRVVSPVGRNTGEFSTRAGFWVSMSGVLVHRGARVEGGRMVWAEGERVLGEAVPIPTGSVFVTVALAPDERRVAYVRDDGASRDVWVTEFERGVTTRLTRGANPIGSLVWSPDSRSVVFVATATDADGQFRVLRRDATAASNEEELLRTSESTTVRDWSRDGRYLLLAMNRGARQGDPAGSGVDLMVLPLTDGPQGRKPVAAVARPFNQTKGRISPDGKWIAYQSNESGTSHAYVQPFSVDADSRTTLMRWQVSTVSASDLAWRADSRAIYFEDRDIGISSGIAESTLIADATGIRWSAPRQVVGSGVARNLDQGFDVARNGRILMLQSPEGFAEGFFTVTVNWQALLRRR